MTWPMSPLVHTPRQVSKSTGRLGVSQTVQGQIGPQEPVTQLCPCPTCQIQHAWNRTYDFFMKHILKHILAPYWVMLIVSLWYDLILFRTEDRCRWLKSLRWNSESTMHHHAMLRHVAPWGTWRKWRATWATSLVSTLLLRRRGSYDHGGSQHQSRRTRRTSGHPKFKMDPTGPNWPLKHRAKHRAKHRVKPWPHSWLAWLDHLYHLYLTNYYELLNELKAWYFRRPTPCGLLPCPRCGFLGTRITGITEISGISDHTLSVDFEVREVVEVTQLATAAALEESAGMGS